MLVLQTIAILFSIIILLFSLNGLLNLYSIISWRGEERENFFRSKKERPNTYFYLIIPALREQNVICKTIERLSMFDYDKKMFEIIVALDKKERESIQNKDSSTFSVLKQYILQRKNNFPKVSFVEYLGEGQKRAFQLNAALDSIHFDSKNRKNVFVGVYDADSHPDLNTLSYINYKHQKNNTLVAFQQMLNYLLNSKKISTLRYSSWILGNAYYQTMWNYIFELKQFFNTNSAIKKGKQSLFPPYCMGHGEFFEYNMLKTVGGFPKDGVADGIQIGFLLSLKGIMINPIPFDDYCESPESLSVIYRQHTFWLFGNIEFFKILSQNGRGIIKFIQALFHLFLSIKWALRPFFYLFTLTLTIYTNLTLVTVSLLFVPFVYYLTSYYLLSKFVNKDADFEIVKLKYFGVEVILGVFFKSFGAINGFIKILKKGLFGTEPVFKKIER